MNTTSKVGEGGERGGDKGVGELREGEGRRKREGREGEGDIKGGGRGRGMTGRIRALC